MTTYTATYSPEDNKLRLYPSARLDAETYDRVKKAGFSWAPKQGLFVAPMWTPQREDLLMELAGEIDDEDKSLVERAEERADRFEDYQEKRADDAERAHAAVSAIADNIPLGQPILVGHHSERHARRDAERIETGMRKAVKMWKTSEYWKDRAKGAIRHAKYKELPAVRARRIKGLEADQRKQEKEKARAGYWLKLWRNMTDDSKFKNKDGNVGTALERARHFAGHADCHLTVTRIDGRPWSAYDVLRPDDERYDDCPAWTVEQVQEAAEQAYPRLIAWCDRWLEHIGFRLDYERAMLAEAGGTTADRTKPEKGGAVQCWVSSVRGGWLYIQKVNKVSVSVLDNWGNGGGNFTRTVSFDKLSGIMTAAQVQAARDTGSLIENAAKTGFHLVGRPTTPPEPEEPTPTTPEPVEQGAGAKFEAMRDALREGVKVVSAPQLFPTPPELADRMVVEANIPAGARVLEPSAGTGAILRAFPGLVPFGDNKQTWCDVVAVEINPQLARALQESGLASTHEADFLNWSGGTFDRIIMNPPFTKGADVAHITHALTMLKPGGRLVAICANGSRQAEKLRPVVDRMGGTWEPLPAGTFEGSGTQVNTVLLVVDAPVAVKAEAAASGPIKEQASLF